MKQRVIVLASILLLMSSGIVSAIGQTASQTNALPYPQYDNSTFSDIKYGFWYDLLSTFGWGPVQRVEEPREIVVEDAVVVKKHAGSFGGIPVGVALGNLALGVAMSSREKFNVRFEGAVPFEFNNKTLFDSLKDGQRIRVTYEGNIHVAHYDKECLNKGFSSQNCLVHRAAYTGGREPRLIGFE